jgi:hypothetical protein
VGDVGEWSDLDRPVTYRIRVRGRLDDQWSGWFDGMTISCQSQGDDPPVTTLTGIVADQAALLGVLIQIASLNLTLISVKRLETGSTQPSRPCGEP